MSVPAPRLRIGSVPYLVGRPLDWGLESLPQVSYQRRVPSALVDGLRSGELDVALVSSIELFRRPGYQTLSGPCVAGQSFVGSVQLFLRRPLAQTERVALDPASRTSAILVQGLLREQLGLAPRFVEVAPGADPRQQGDAWLRIGDRALAESAELGAESAAACSSEGPAWNPSDNWRRHTGLPFVFACWIAREEVPLESLRELFETAAARGRERLDRLAQDGAGELGLDRGRISRYLCNECTYQLDPESFARALARFRDLAASVGACDGSLWPGGLDRP